MLTAGRGAEEEALDLNGTFQQRRATLDRLAEEARAAADWLSALLAGETHDDLPDQSELIESLLQPEQRLMEQMIDLHLRQPANRLQRWNGHAVLDRRLSEIRDLLGAEVLVARGALVGAAKHDLERYRLDHVWDDLELRFGRIRYEPGRVEGSWADPTDRKSAYLYFLESRAGELQLVLPWADSPIR